MKHLPNIACLAVSFVAVATPGSPPEALARIRDKGFFERAMEGGSITQAALAALAVAGILSLAWLLLAIRRRRLSPLPGGIALTLAISSYLVLDWRHISLNFAMRDAQAVRHDCEQVLQRRKSTVENEYIELHLSGSEIPESFTRLGAKFVRVTRENVQISLISDWNGACWGFLYDPKRAYLTDGWPDDIRPTWYHDFYEFRVHGE